MAARLRTVEYFMAIQSLGGQVILSWEYDDKCWTMRSLIKVPGETRMRCEETKGFK
jgi:hypothetical protein